MQSSGGEKLCPICDSPLQAGSKKCSFCGTDLSIFDIEVEGPKKVAVSSPAPSKVSLDSRVDEVMSMPQAAAPAAPPPRKAEITSPAPQPSVTKEPTPEPAKKPQLAESSRIEAQQPAPAPKAPPPARAIPAVKEETFACPQCESQIPVSASTCPKCGVMFAEEGSEMFQCPACNTLVNVDASQCPGCGAMFVESAEAPQAPSAPAPGPEPVPAKEELEPAVEEVKPAPKAAPSEEVEEKQEEEQKAGKKLGGWFKWGKKEPEAKPEPKKPPKEEPASSKPSPPSETRIPAASPKPAPKAAAAPQPVREAAPLQPQRVAEPIREAPRPTVADAARHSEVTPAPAPAAAPGGGKDKGRDLARMVAEMKPLLALAREKDVDIGESKQLIDDAAIAGKERQLDRAIELVQRSKVALMQKIDAHLGSLISRLNEEIKVARDFGGDISRATAYMQEVTKARTTGDPEAAYVYIDKVAKELLPITGRYNEAKRKLSSLKQLIADCDAFIVDTKEARRCLVEASKAFDLRDFDKSEALIKAANDNLYKSIPARMNDEMKKAREELIDLKVKDVNISPLLTVLKSATGLMKAGDYGEAVREMRSFRELIKKSS